MTTSWRFYEHASFYGGTALRIFHRLPRFSEEMDFSLLVPIPFQVRLFTLPCLFAGKLHDLLCRAWKNRVKGRDFYDLVWYLGRETPVHLTHLQARMVQTGHWNGEEVLDLEKLRGLLAQRFKEVNFPQASADVRPFLRDSSPLDLWSREFFERLLPRLKGS